MIALLTVACATLGALLPAEEPGAPLPTDEETLYDGEPPCLRGVYTIHCNGCEPAWGPTTVPFDCLADDPQWDLRLWNMALPGGIAEWRGTRPGVDMRAEYMGDL